MLGSPCQSFVTWPWSQVCPLGSLGEEAEGREWVLRDNLLSHSHLSKPSDPFLCSVLSAGLAFRLCLVLAPLGPC